MPMGMKDVLILRTRGFITQIPADEQATIMAITLQNISPSTDFVIFDPTVEKKTIEDEGRTVHFAFKTIPKKVFARLDDYGSVEALRENSGMNVNTQYALTFMLAEDY